MSDRGNRYETVLVVYLVYDAVGSDSHAVERKASQFDGARTPWIVSKRENRLVYPADYCYGQRFKFPYSGWLDLDPAGQRRPDVFRRRRTFS